MRTERSVSAPAPALLILLLLLTGCGSDARPGRAHSTDTRVTVVEVHRLPARSVTPPPMQALVTAPTENRLLVVDLPSGRVIRRVTLPAAPEYVATCCKGGPVVVVSVSAGEVELLGRPSLRVVKVFGGFDQPHIVEISPDADYAYVSDDGHGQVAVIGLYDDKLLSRVTVGPGAHHLTFSPDQHQVWVALGQAAGTIRILTLAASARRPGVIGQFDPGFLAHQPLFSPDGREVWITSAAGIDVGVFSARSHHLLFRVPAGPPPQHIVFDGGSAYITSGYGSSIERVTLSGRVVRRVSAPYGSFELDASHGLVVTTSLLRGTLAVYDTGLDLLHVRRLAPSAEDVVISSP